MEPSYLNMKKIYDPEEKPQEYSGEWKQVKLSPHPNFENANVTLEVSAVHLPINVYEVSPL